MASRHRSHAASAAGGRGRAVAGVTPLDLDDVDRRLDDDHGRLREQCTAAAALVADEQQRFQAWLAGYAAAPAVAALHEHAEAIVAAVLSENDGHWEDLTGAGRERVGVLRTVVRRLLHEPARRLRASGPAAAAEGARAVRSRRRARRRGLRRRRARALARRPARRAR